MYRWVEHTAELELEIDAASEEEVLAEALRALRELLNGEPAEVGEAGAREPGEGRCERRTVAVSAGDRPALLAAWLEELVFLAESEGFVPGGVEQLELTPDGVCAVLAGWIGDPPPLVKAVTYHRLAFEPDDGGYRARVILDV